MTKMNHCFRNVMIRCRDLRTISYSTLTALKRPEHIALAVNGAGPDVNINIKTQPTSQEIFQLFRQNQQKQCKVEQAKSFINSNLLDHQNTSLECLINKQTPVTREESADSVIGNKNNVRRNANHVFFEKNFSGVDPELWKLHTSKTSVIPQKANTVVKKRNHLSNGKDGNVGDNKTNLKKSQVDDDKPTYAQLQKVANYYEQRIEVLHVTSEDLTLGLHNENLVFENNYSKYPKSCQGLSSYIMGLAKMRILANLSYASFRFVALDTRCDVDEGTVVLHWRFYYLNNLRFFTKAVPTVIWERSFANMHDHDEAISTFTVNKDGQVVKHKVDRTMAIKQKQRAGVVERLRKRLKLAVT